MSLGVGIVQLNESSDASEVPAGGNGLVGYFTDGFIFDDENGDSGRETKGNTKNRQQKFAQLLPDKLILRLRRKT